MSEPSARSFRPADPDRLPEDLARWLDRTPYPGRALRVLIDGPASADPGGVAEALLAPLARLGRRGAHVRAAHFWRDASLRLEYGRTDAHSYLHGWLDAAALNREVLHPLGPEGTGRFLPSLRDPEINRATRTEPVDAAPGAVALISGDLLLGKDLAADVAIHLAVSAPARARQVDPGREWTLEAYLDYDRTVDPIGRADLVIRYDDPRHPALSAALGD